MKIEPDGWLAGVFGHPVFKVSLSDQEGSEGISPVSEETLCISSQGQPAFYYAKIPTTQVRRVRTLTAAGFSVVDVNVTFEREPVRCPDWTAGGNIIVRDILPSEHECVLDIAASCFVYSRFHLDSQVPNQVANAVKRAWIDSYCHKRRGERLLVAELDGKPVGFNAVLATAMGIEPVRVIDLIGVDKAYQGRAVGKRLVEHFIHDSAGRYARLRVGTQAANIPSMRLYEGCGFRVAETAYLLHAHVRDGEVIR